MASGNVTVTLDSRVRIADDVKCQELQGEMVLLDMKSATYFGLEGVGTRIWQLISESDRLADVVASIAAQYDVNEQRCSRETIDLVSELARVGLVTVSSR